MAVDGESWNSIVPSVDQGIAISTIWTSNNTNRVH